MTDNFYFVHQPLAGNGSITVRVTSLTGTAQRTASLADRVDPPTRARPQPWAKAGIIIKASTKPGSAYAAIMVTGSHGVRMQYDYTHDTAGPAGRRLRGVSALAAADPLRRHDHRLRLGRRHPLDPGRHRPPDRAAVHRAGRAVRRLARRTTWPPSPSAATQRHRRRPSQATAVFDHVSLGGRTWPVPGRGPATALIGGQPTASPVEPGGQRAGTGRPRFTVTGSGDIAPV